MLVRDLLIMKKLKLKIGRGFCYVDHRLHMNDEIICIIVLLLFYLSLVNLNAFLFFFFFLFSFDSIVDSDYKIHVSAFPR
jgi:hypothetical protein